MFRCLCGTEINITAKCVLDSPFVVSLICTVKNYVLNTQLLSLGVVVVVVVRVTVKLI